MNLLRRLRGIVAWAWLGLLLGVQRLLVKRRPRGPARILVPFTNGGLDPTVLDAAVRLARAEDATLVPAYLILIPYEFAIDAPMHGEVAVAMPLLEAVERTATLSGVPVDARVESGRTAIHALERLWSAEPFDRIVVPAPPGRGGFTPADLLWILTHAPSETLILRPDPEAPPAGRLQRLPRWAVTGSNRRPLLVREDRLRAGALPCDRNRRFRGFLRVTNSSSAPKRILARSKA